MKLSIGKVLLAIVLVLKISLSFSTDVLKLNDSNEEYFLTPYIEILEDKNKEFNIEQVASPEFDSLFHTPDRSVPINNNLKSAYWIKFVLHDTSSQHTNWILESYDFKMDKISFYYQNDKGEFVQKTMGDVFPFQHKIIGHKNFEFLIPLKDGVQTFYIRVESEQFVAFYFVLKSIPRFINYSLKEYYFLGFFYGIIVLICLLNLFLFFKVRDAAHLYYVLYILSIGLLFMTMDGTAYQFLWPDHPEFNKYPSAVASLFMVISALLYARSFLTSINKVLINVIIFTAIVTKVSIFFYRFFYSPYDLWDPFLDWEILLAPLILGVLALYNGYKPALYYVAAFTFVSLGFLTYALMFQGIIPANVLTVYSLNYAEIIEIILLSLALAHRVRILKLEKEKAQEERMNELIMKEKLQREIISHLKINEELKDKVNRELEEKVAERTNELAVAYDEINRMNELLKIDNTNLQVDIKKQAKDRVMLKPLNFEEFKGIYPDDESCYKYLEDLKWSKGYQCRKCGNTNYIRGKYDNSRRCTRCRYDESVTAHTIFDNQKFSILKAFYMIFLILERREITEEELASMLEMRRPTCGDFKRKFLAILQGKKKVKNNKEGWGDLVLNPD
jgi:hypothetical protein